MHAFFLKSSVILATCVLAGCSPKSAGTGGDSGATASRDAVTMVEDDERSRHFAAVTRQLELGGTIFAYVDIDGDILELIAGLQSLLDQIAAAQPQLAFLQQDLGALFRDLGCDDIKAIGLSSVETTGGVFRNRVFLYTPDGRHGLLAGLGGPAKPFAHLATVPADVDFYFENEADIPAIYSAVRRVVARVAGDGMASLIDAQLKVAGREAGVSALDLIQRAKGSLSLVLRFEKEQIVPLPTGTNLTVPGLSLLLRCDGIAPALGPMLDQLPLLARTEEAGRIYYALQVPLPVPGIAPVLVADGDGLFLATTREFFEACRGQATSLAQVPEFADALAEIGREGNGLTYVSPRFLERVLHFARAAVRTSSPDSPVLKLIDSEFAAVRTPLVSVRINRDDGVLFRSRWNSSLKSDVLVAAINPVAILASILVPTVETVRERSQEVRIRNNLRDLYNAALVHYNDRGVNSVTFDELVGPGKAIASLVSVAGEDYRSIIFKGGQPLTVKTAGGRVITHPEVSSE